MDVRLISMPSVVSDILLIIGLLWVCHAALWFLQNMLSLYYHKEPYKNPEELRYFLILEENKKLNQKIETLEEENAQIISSIINKLNT